jgi:hypothetical protein
MLRDLPDARVVAVAPGEADGGLPRFDRAAGVTAETTRYASHQDPLAAGGVDAVQVCVEPMRTAAILAAPAASRRLPFSPAARRPVPAESHGLPQTPGAIGAPIGYEPIRVPPDGRTSRLP